MNAANTTRKLKEEGEEEEKDKGTEQGVAPPSPAARCCPPPSFFSPLPVGLWEESDGWEGRDMYAVSRKNRWTPTAFRQCYGWGEGYSNPLLGFQIGMAENRGTVT